MVSSLRSLPRVGAIGIRGDFEAGHDRVAGRVGVVDEEPAVAGVVGVKGDRQQPLLAARAHSRRDVQKRGGFQDIAPQEEDPPTAIDHEDAIVAGVRDGDRRADTSSDDGFEVDLRARARRTAADGDEQDGEGVLHASHRSMAPSG